METNINNSLNKTYGLLLLLLIGMSGCCRKNKQCLKRTEKNKPVLFSEVDLPTATDEIIYKYLDDDMVGELKTLDSFDENKLADSDLDDAALFDQIEDVRWLEENNGSRKKSFKTVYFDFDKYTIRKDQEEHVQDNIALAKELLTKNNDQTPKEIIVNGHSDDSAGSDVYNMILSERRAQALADRLVANNIPRESIKIVGRGSSIPAIINGKAVKGDRVQQAPNRRDEIRVVYV